MLVINIWVIMVNRDVEGVFRNGDFRDVNF